MPTVGSARYTFIRSTCRPVAQNPPVTVGESLRQDLHVSLGRETLGDVVVKRQRMSAIRIDLDLHGAREPNEVSGTGPRNQCQRDGPLP